MVSFTDCILVYIKHIEVKNGYDYEDLLKMNEEKKSSILLKHKRKHKIENIR